MLVLESLTLRTGFNPILKEEEGEEEGEGEEGRGRRGGRGEWR